MCFHPLNGVCLFASTRNRRSSMRQYRCRWVYTVNVRFCYILLLTASRYCIRLFKGCNRIYDGLIFMWHRVLCLVKRDSFDTSLTADVYLLLLRRKSQNLQPINLQHLFLKWCYLTVLLQNEVILTVNYLQV